MSQEVGKRTVKLLQYLSKMCISIEKNKLNQGINENELLFFVDSYMCHFVEDLKTKGLLDDQIEKI